MVWRRWRTSKTLHTSRQFGPSDATVGSEHSIHVPTGDFCFGLYFRVVFGVRFVRGARTSLEGYVLTRLWLGAVRSCTLKPFGRYGRLQSHAPGLLHLNFQLWFTFLWLLCMEQLGRGSGHCSSDLGNKATDVVGSGNGATSLRVLVTALPGKHRRSLAVGKAHWAPHFGAPLGHDTTHIAISSSRSMWMWIPHDQQKWRKRKEIFHADLLPQGKKMGCRKLYFVVVTDYDIKPSHVFWRER